MSQPETPAPSTDSQRSSLQIRYLLGSEDGQPITVGLRHHPDLLDGFDTNEYLAGLVEQFAARAGLEIPDGEVAPLEMVVLGSMAMAYKTHAAILHLCRLGYGGDALARVRTLFELAVDLRYMRQECAQERAERWLDWAKVVQYRLLGVLERGDDYFEAARAALVAKPQEKQAVLEAIARVKAKGTHWYVDDKGKRRPPRHWSGLDTANIAHEVGWANAYDTLFREASQFIHPGVHGFTGLFHFDDPPDWVTIDARPSPEGIRGVLSSAAIYFGHIARDWAEVLGTDEVASKLRDWMSDKPIDVEPPA